MDELTLFRKKVRWQMRRGLLELDILMARFIESGAFDDLTYDELKALWAILQWPDQDFLQVIQGSLGVENPEQENIIKKLQEK